MVCSTTRTKRATTQWRSINTILGSDKTKKTISKDEPAAQDLNFFNEKVDAVRRSTGGGPIQSSQPLMMESFNTLTPVTVNDVKNTITSAPPKSCDLDSLPTNVPKEFMSELSPYLRSATSRLARVVYYRASVMPSSRRA